MSKTYHKKMDLLDLSKYTFDDIESKEATDWIEENNTGEFVINYIALGFSSENKCDIMSHGALVVQTTHRIYGLEWGNLVAVGKKEVKRFMTDNKHPNGSWFTCILRSQKIMGSKKGITLDDILVHAEAKMLLDGKVVTVLSHLTINLPVVLNPIF